MDFVFLVLFWCFLEWLDDGDDGSCLPRRLVPWFCPPLLLTLMHLDALYLLVDKIGATHCVNISTSAAGCFTGCR